MKALPIDPALATLMQVGHQVATAEGAGPIFREWCVTDLPAGLWRADAAIEIPVPSTEAPPRPSGPCATWLKVEPVKRSSPDDGPPWRLVAEDAKGSYGNWGGIPPDIQIACADFLTSWEEWRLRHLAARSEDGRWEQCEKAGQWAASTPGRSLWLKVKFRGDDSDHDLLINVEHAGDERILTLTPAAYAIEQPSCGFEAAMVDDIKRHPVGGLARGGADVVALQIVGREIVRPSPSALLMDTALTVSSLGLERGSAALRALNDPRARTGHTETETLADIESVCRRLGAGDPWVFINSETPAELLSAALLARAEAGDRVLCVVPDESALMDVAIATAPWLPRDALVPSVTAEKMLASLPPAPAISLSALEEDLRMVNERLGVLAASAGDRAKKLAEGPFIGEGAATDRMKRSQASSSETLHAVLEGIDWRRGAPFTDEDARTLRALLSETLADGPDRHLPSAAIIPRSEVIGKIAARIAGEKHAEWLVGDLLDRGPPVGGWIDTGRRLVERLVTSQDAVDGSIAVLPEITVTAVFHHLSNRLRDLSARTHLATERLVDYAHLVRGRTVVVDGGADMRSVSDAAKRHHAMLANPNPGPRWLLGSSPRAVPEILRSVTIDGMPCTSVDDFRTLIEWTELELMIERAGIPELEKEWRGYLKTKSSLGSRGPIADMHSLSTLVLGVSDLINGLDDATKAFDVAFPMDQARAHSKGWVRILRTFVDAPDEWQDIHSALQLTSSSGPKRDPLIDTLVAALRALDIETIERIRDEIGSYHRVRANVTLRDALIKRVDAAAPLLASRLRDRERSAVAVLEDLPRLWDLARVRAWQDGPDAAECLEADTQAIDLGRQRAELTDKMRFARLRDSLAAAVANPPIQVIQTSEVARRVSLYNKCFDLVAFWATGAFPPELYAVLGLAKHVAVVGNELMVATDSATDLMVNIGELRDTGGIISLAAPSRG